MPPAQQGAVEELVQSRVRALLAADSGSDSADDDEAPYLTPDRAPPFFADSRPRAAISTSAPPAAGRGRERQQLLWEENQKLRASFESMESRYKQVTAEAIRIVEARAKSWVQNLLQQRLVEKKQLKVAIANAQVAHQKALADMRVRLEYAEGRVLQAERAVMQAQLCMDSSEQHAAEAAAAQQKQAQQQAQQMQQPQQPTSKNLVRAFDDSAAGGAADDEDQLALQLEAMREFSEQAADTIRRLRVRVMELVAQVKSADGQLAASDSAIFTLQAELDEKSRTVRGLRRLVSSGASGAAAANPAEQHHRSAASERSAADSIDRLQVSPPPPGGGDTTASHCRLRAWPARRSFTAAGSFQQVFSSQLPPTASPTHSSCPPPPLCRPTFSAEPSRWKRWWAGTRAPRPLPSTAWSRTSSQSWSTAAAAAASSRLTAPRLSTRCGGRRGMGPRSRVCTAGWTASAMASRRAG